MPHAPLHPNHRTPAPRACRDVAHLHVPRYAARGAWHSHAAEPAPREPDSVGAQTAFYVARGVAVLLAAVAVGLGAASEEAGQVSAPSSASSQTTAR
jgi:hypothetical protein